MYSLISPQANAYGTQRPLPERATVPHYYIIPDMSHVPSICVLDRFSFCRCHVLGVDRCCLFLWPFAAISYEPLLQNIRFIFTGVGAVRHRTKSVSGSYCTMLRARKHVLVWCKGRSIKTLSPSPPWRQNGQKTRAARVCEFEKCENDVTRNLFRVILRTADHTFADLEKKERLWWTYLFVRLVFERLSKRSKKN